MSPAEEVVRVGIRLLDPIAMVPDYARPLDAGADLVLLDPAACYGGEAAGLVLPAAISGHTVASIAAAVELIHAGVDYQIRETVESAYLMGAQGLRALGCSEAVVSETLQDIRSRDNERLGQQVQNGAMAGRDRLYQTLTPEPLVKAKKDTA